MQLYSITYDKVTKVTRYDAKGRVEKEYDDRVRVTMNDLPLQTAQMYRDKMVDCNVVITPQYLSSSEPQRRGKGDYSARTKSSAPRQVSKKPVETKSDRIKNAAASGDMTAAINEKGK